MSRYDVREIFRTSNAIYEKKLKDRKLNHFRYFATPRFEKYEEEELDDIDDIGHTWSMGDRFYKLAHKHYGDSELWWIIAWYNQTPTEAHLQIGDTVLIPTPLWRIRSILGA
jgi:hypothetical protein